MLRELFPKRDMALLTSTLSVWYVVYDAPAGSAAVGALSATSQLHRRHV